MLARLRHVLEGEPDVAHAGSDADIAGAARDVRTAGRLAARLESAIGRPVDLVLSDHP